MKIARFEVYPYVHECGRLPLPDEIAEADEDVIREYIFQNMSDAILAEDSRDYSGADVDFDGVEDTDDINREARLIATNVCPDDIAKAEKILVDNGIEKDEAAEVLRAIGYALLDTELYPDK